MPGKKPEDSRFDAFYNGAPSDYFTTNTTPRRSSVIRDILAEEANSRARGGNVDTAEMEVASAESDTEETKPVKGKQGKRITKKEYKAMTPRERFEFNRDFYPIWVKE